MAAEIDTDVVVVGAGPAGLMLAGELRLGGAAVIVVEKLAEPTAESRASTVHARTMELFDQRGLLEELDGPPRGGPGHFGGIPLDLTLPGPYPGQWKVPQARIEALLGRWAAGLGARLLRGRELFRLAEKPGWVEAEVLGPDGPRLLRARFLVGCDGERSTVRRLGGFAFPGRDAAKELFRTDVAGIEVPDRRFERHPNGLAIASRGPDGVTRVMVHAYGAPVRERTEAPAFSEVAAAWASVTGEDISGGTPLWVNAFDDTCRQAAEYVRGRIALAGDAAHRQLPAGGQALNLGLQDAANLGWKLAAHLRGEAGPGLLATYHRERHAVGERALANIAAQALLLLGGPEVEAVRSVFRELLETETVRRALAGAISGLDIRYRAAPGDHPLLGARLPHCRLKTSDGPVSTLGLLRRGRAVLLDLTADKAMQEEAAPWADRVRTVEAVPGGEGEAPGFGSALVRPDGYVVWADGTATELRAALREWFGGPGRR